MQSAALFLEQTRLLEQISGHQSPKKEETVDIYGGSIKSTYADGSWNQALISSVLESALGLLKIENI